MGVNVKKRDELKKYINVVLFYVIFKKSHTDPNPHRLSHYL